MSPIITQQAILPYDTQIFKSLVEMSTDIEKSKDLYVKVQFNFICGTNVTWMTLPMGREIPSRSAKEEHECRI